MSSGTQPQGQKFIVVFKDGVTSDEITKYVNEIEGAGGALGQRWDEGGGILNGFAATIPESALTNLQSLVGGVVDYIEPDGIVTTQ